MTSELKGLKGYTDGYIFDENENCIGKTYNRDHAKIIADAFERDRNTRAVPDVPELVTVAGEYLDGHMWKQMPSYLTDFSLRGIKTRGLVTRQNAEEVIAAKDARIAELEAERDHSVRVKGVNTKYAHALVNLGMCEDDDAETFAESINTQISKLKADNKRLREALKNIVERFSYYADLARDGVPNIEDWAYTEGSSDIAKARAALGEVKKG